MSDNIGKKFERRFQKNFLKMPGSTIDRLYDVTLGYENISQICDFIGYVYPNIVYVECKAYKGNTFPLSKLTQYDKLLAKKDVNGAIAGAVIWFYERDKVLFAPIKTIEQMKNDGKKSIKYTDDELYNIIDVPSVKRRTFMDSDYSVIFKEVKNG